MIFPLVYGPLFILVFFFIKGIFGETSTWMLIALFPILTMGLDYMENFNTLEMLSSFLNLSEAMVDKGSSFSEKKHFLTLLSNLLYVGLGFLWLVVMGKKYMSNKEI